MVKECRKGVCLWFVPTLCQPFLGSRHQSRSPHLCSGGGTAPDIGRIEANNDGTEMLDITYGDTKNSGIVSALVASLEGRQMTGDLFVGYPILGGVEGRIEVDALLVTREHGVVAFDLQSGNVRSFGDANASHLTQRQDDIYVSLENKLKSYSTLRAGRNLAFEMRVISVVPEVEGPNENQDHYIATAEQVASIVETFEGLEENLQRALNAALQHTATIRPKKRRAQVSSANSRGAVMRHIEAAIANMDAWQKKAAIEFPEGPQRIRGLAGSGKTIVLAQKAAILHAKYPDWDIAVTFQTRSLYQQFRGLIERFYRELTLDDPDWSKLSVLHAWGSAASDGLYYSVAKSIGHSVKDFSYAKSKYGYDRAFEGICSELLSDLDGGATPKRFDVILIDEAQDFPQPFFEIVFHSTKDPHRIVWAYDELQNLSDYTMPPASELFGKKIDGSPRVELKNTEDSPQQDIVLPVCYRNTKWAITTAHSIGLGVYRDKGFVQFFDAPELWDDIGYRFLKGKPKGGNQVSIDRNPSSSPAYFNEFLTAEDAVLFSQFNSVDKQYKWVAESIKKNIEEDELDPDDIMVVFCSPMTIREDSASMMRALRRENISSHVPGVTSSRDEMFKSDSVALTGIYRAKGNEAPLVYVVNADYCFEGFELSKRRNILFTAMTRSRAWVRVSGVGAKMAGIAGEAEKVFANDFRLNFQYPTKAEIDKIKRLHRDMPEAEKIAIESDLEGLLRLLKRVEDGDIDPDHLPKDVASAIKKMISKR